MILPKGASPFSPRLVRQALRVALEFLALAAAGGTIITILQGLKPEFDLT
jgi:hypothetical protein